MSAYNVTFGYEDQPAFEEQLAGFLRSLGWACEKGGEWLAPWQVAQRYKVTHPAKMSMQLQRFEQRGDVLLAKRGTTGRLLRLRITPTLHAYLMKLNRGGK